MIDGVWFRLIGVLCSIHTLCAHIYTSMPSVGVFFILANSFRNRREDKRTELAMATCRRLAEQTKSDDKMIF